MSENKPRGESLEQADSCFHFDGSGKPVFSVSEFIRLNGLPDDPRLRKVIIEELLEVLPDVRILEDCN